MEYHVYWLLKGSCFDFFGDEKYGFFWAKKLMEIWYLLIIGKFLFWSFWECKIRSFFEPKKLWKDDIYWLLKNFCFKLFGDGKYGLFFESKSWWKDDVCWLLRSYCFELSGDGKCGLFSVKKLMKRWYLLRILNLRAWEIRFFVQCIAVYIRYS